MSVESGWPGLGPGHSARPPGAAPEASLRRLAARPMMGRRVTEPELIRVIELVFGSVPKSGLSRAVPLADNRPDGPVNPVVATEVGDGSEGDLELEDDLDGSPTDETVRFGFDGPSMRSTRPRRTARAFRAQLAQFVEHAPKRGRGPARRATRTAAGRQRSGEVRAWATDQGIPAAHRRCCWGRVHRHASVRWSWSRVHRGDRAH